MAAALQIVSFISMFWDKAMPLIKAGVDVTAEWQKNKAQAEQMAREDRAPLPAEWEALHAGMDQLEKSIQSAHRDVP